MSLHAAFGASHGCSGLRHVEPLQVAQKEGLPLPLGQRMQRLLERTHRLVHLEPRHRLRLRARRLGDRVRLLVLIVSAPRQPRHHAAAHRPPPLHVADPVLQDSVEQRLPLLRAAVRVGARELQHRVLHRIQRIFLVAQARKRELESLELDAREEPVEGGRAKPGCRIVQ